MGEFTLCANLEANEEEHRSFLRGLSETVGDADVQATVVLDVRADFYAHCAEHPELVEIEMMQDRPMLVGVMNQPDLREVIVGSATQAGLTLESGLVETVLSDLGEESSALPLLSHALVATWGLRRDRMLAG